MQIALAFHVSFRSRAAPGTTVTAAVWQIYGLARVAGRAPVGRLLAETRGAMAPRGAASPATLTAHSTVRRVERDVIVSDLSKVRRGKQLDTESGTVPVDGWAGAAGLNGPICGAWDWARDHECLL